MSNLPTEAKNTIQGILDGNVTNVHMSYNDGNFELYADSLDKKERYIIKKESFNGYLSNTNTLVEKPASVQDRQERVKHLLKKKYTQSKIAELCMCSQKTISNDIKAIENEKKK